MNIEYKWMKSWKKEISRYVVMGPMWLASQDETTSEAEWQNNTELSFITVGEKASGFYSSN